MFCSRKSRRIVCRDNRCLETFCNIHDRRINFLHICYPKIQCSGSKHQFCTDCIGQWDNALITVHRRKSGTADAVKLNALCSFFFRKFLKFLALSSLYDLFYQNRQMSVNCDIYIAFFQCSDVYLGSHTITDSKQCIGCDRCRNNTAECKGKSTAKKLFHHALPVSVRRTACFVVSFKHFVISTDRQNIHIFPYFLTLRCRTGSDHFVFIRLCSR